VTPGLASSLAAVRAEMAAEPVRRTIRLLPGGAAQSSRGGVEGHAISEIGLTLRRSHRSETSSAGVESGPREALAAHYASVLRRMAANRTEAGNGEGSHE
jgi:hypothetical protein